MPNSTRPANDALTDTSVEHDSTVAPDYAEVAIPLGVIQTFTYGLSPALRKEAQLGARVVVPFGRQQITGYIVGFHQASDVSDRVDPADIKEVLEVLDPEPLLTPEVIALTRWVSEYYAAPLGEVLKGALPAGLNAKVETILSITSLGRSAASDLQSTPRAGLKSRALDLIATTGEMSKRLLARELGAAQASRVAGELHRAGWITVEHKQGSIVAHTKRRKAVRLAPTKQETNGACSSFVGSATTHS